MTAYDYANARLRALKSRLFDRRAYAELAALERLDDLIARLAQSTYAGEIEVALARYMGPRVVTEACRLHLARVYRAIRGFFTADGARLIDILLARWDLFNLKTIVRGQMAGARPEEIVEALVPAGSLDENGLRMLARQPNPLAAIDLLGTWQIDYARMARAAFARFTATQDWSAFETTLDARFYAWLLATLHTGVENDELVRESLAREIDAANLLAALRLRQAGPPSDDASVARHFIDGGALTSAWLVSLARATRDEEARALVRGSRFGAALAGLERLDLHDLQRALDRDIARFGVAFFSRDPLTIATAIGFIAAKRIEAANVRMIAQGVALGLDRAEIESELIVV